MSKPELIAEKAVMRAAIKKLRAAGQTIGLVPTMGALHAGHLSLVKESIAQCDITVVTIFVNPLQFNEENDLTGYPRDLAADVSILSQLSVDYVFAPTPEQIYPRGHCLSIDVGPLGHMLEGRFRPGHFAGVATILLKLFHLIPSDIAFFGTKDYQQLKVVERMVEDSNLPIQIIGCPTVREEDGLAMSSRNQLLTAADRLQAKCVYESFQQAQIMVTAGERKSEKIIQKMRQHIHHANGKIDYVALVDPSTLQPQQHIIENILGLIAVRIGSIRLIDNWLIQVNTDQSSLHQ